MKTPRAKKLADDPSIKGNLTAEEIVTTDWKRNYEKKGVPLLSMKKIIKQHVDDGGQVVRLRNTLILLSMEEGDDEAMFHTMTADVFEVYASMMQLFALSLAKARGVETAYTYINDKSPYRMARKLFGDANVDFEEADESGDGKYKLTIDVGDYYRSGAKAAEAEAGR